MIVTKIVTKLKCLSQDLYIDLSMISTNIYLCDLDRNVSYKNVSFDKSIMVMTVKDKKKLYTARQVKSAELAREYQRKLGYASPG